MIEAQIKALEDLLRDKEAELNDQHREVTYEGIPREALHEYSHEMLRLMEMDQQDELDQLSANSEDGQPLEQTQNLSSVSLMSDIADYLVNESEMQQCLQLHSVECV